MSILSYVLAMLLLLAGSAFFSSAEMALSSANRLRLENAAEEGSRRARLACALSDRYEDTLSAILIGNNLCNIGSDALATVITVLLVGRRYTALSTALMVLVVIIFCESAPKIIAKQNANRWTLACAGTLRFLSIVLLPLIWLVRALVALLTLPFRGEEHDADGEEAAAELQSIIETVEDEGVIDEERGEMLQAALDFSEVSAMDVMTARVDVEALDVDDDWEDILSQVSEAPYSRIPVYEDGIDDIIGILYLNHFFRALLDQGEGPVDLRPLLLPASYVYKTTRLPEVLRTLRQGQQHMAVVTDEYGGTLGIVTLEDVMEQIVGDIWDESDVVETDVVERAEGVLELDGDLPVDELAELLGLDEEELDTESATIGGWTIERFGSFPRVGESFLWRDQRVTVLAMDEDGLRVERVLVEKVPAGREDET